MEPVILEYFPIKAVSQFYFREPVPLFQLFGKKSGWDKIEDYPEMYSWNHTVIGKDKNGLFCDANGHIWEIVSEADIDKEVLKRKKWQEKERREEPKKETARKVVKAASYVGGGAAVMLGARVREGTVKKVEDGINSFLDLDSYFLDFDETEFRNRFIRIGTSDRWAEYSTGGVENIQVRPIQHERKIVRGLPSGYTGKRTGTCSITFEGEINYLGKPEYLIFEYADVQTANQVWAALKKYGFV